MQVLGISSAPAVSITFHLFYSCVSHFSYKGTERQMNTSRTVSEHRSKI